ncbi:MAG: hypothetical protein KDD11_08505 [Acidobacteria bacterium]|nr:hypothetical protein [Acidobacteriota bacterium]
MSPRAVAAYALLLTWLSAAVALLAGMFLGPRAPVTIVALTVTIGLMLISMVARRL